MNRCWIALLGLLLTVKLAPAGTFAVTVAVVDAQNKPVATAVASQFWMASDGIMQARPAHPTGADGKVKLVIDDWNERRPILIYSDDRKQGCLIGASAADAGRELRAELRPTTRISGTLNCSELGAPPAKWIGIVGSHDFRVGAYFVQCQADKPAFELVLPPGRYQLTLDGVDTKRIPHELVVDGSQPELNLGVIDLPAGTLAKLRGKPAPPLTITELRGLKPGTTLADFKGKCVMLDFWGWWCGPCVCGSLPEAMAFQKAYAAHQDKFVILAVHGRGAKTLAEMDAKLPPIRAANWNGSTLR